MTDQPQMRANISLWERLAYRIHRRTWWWTMPVAKWINNRYCVRKANGPGYFPRWQRRLLGGLYVATWTHICGHGLRYSFDTGCIYWFPRYARRRLNLPTTPR